MKNILFKSIMALSSVALLFAATSCQETFLEETNPNQISTDSFWKTLNDLESGMVAVYASFANENITQIVNENHRSDIDWPGWGRPTTNNPFFLQTFTNSEGAVANKWAGLYEGIFRANQVIEAYENLKGSFATEEGEERAAEINAEARFFRGLYHFYLHSSFNEGKVIIFDFVPKDLEDFYQPIKPADDVLKFFRNDLRFAAANLPPKWLEFIDKGRVTAGAAEAVLGKSHLYMADYDSAAYYFGNVISNPDYGYALTPDIEMNFHSQNEFNSESILEVSYSMNFKSAVTINDKENTAHRLAFSFSTPPDGQRFSYPACWLIMAHREEKMDLTDAANYVVAKDWLQNPIAASNGADSMRLRVLSRRTEQSIALPDDQDHLYYTVYAAQKAQFNNGEPAYWRKYTNSDFAVSEVTNSADSRGGSNIRLIRLADVYLMFAECLIKGGGNLDDAMLLINRVRKRSGLELIGPDGSGEYPASTHDNQTYTSDQLMDHLMYIERPMELASEGHAIRFFDLRRWGILKQRFDELAVGLYNAENVPFVDVEGKNQTKWASKLIRVATAAEAHPRYVDRSMPADNFDASVHSYLPIPNTEETGNPNLYNETE